MSCESFIASCIAWLDEAKAIQCKIVSIGCAGVTVGTRSFSSINGYTPRGTVGSGPTAALAPAQLQGDMTHVRLSEASAPGAPENVGVRITLDSSSPRVRLTLKSRGDARVSFTPLCMGESFVGEASGTTWVVTLCKVEAFR